MRVAGSGDTNYAIAKDDVGNWYVKAYESDPEKIVQGMKSLAMFSFGVPNATTNTTGEGQKAEGSASGLDTIFTRYKEKYATQTSADYAQLVSDHKPDTIKAAITAAWEKNVTDADTRGLLAKDLTDSKPRCWRPGRNSPTRRIRQSRPAASSMVSTSSFASAIRSCRESRLASSTMRSILRRKGRSTR